MDAVTWIRATEKDYSKPQPPAVVKKKLVLADNHNCCISLVPKTTVKNPPQKKMKI